MDIEEKIKSKREWTIGEIQNRLFGLNKKQKNRRRTSLAKNTRKKNRG